LRSPGDPHDIAGVKALWLLVVVGCAKGGSGLSDAPIAGVDSPSPMIDADETVDSAHGIDASLIDSGIHDSSVLPDAFVPDAMVMIDAAPMVDAHPDAGADAAPTPDAMVDAAPMIDAPMVDAACVPMTTELLKNPAFDLSPRAVDWSEISDSGLDLITDDSGTPAPDTAPYRAWLGGVDDDTDDLYQNVTIPANTTKLELTGVYSVGSSETGTTIYDKLELALYQTNGTTVVEDAIKLSNVSVTAVAWTPLDHVFSANLSGQTLQIRFHATNDVSNETSFFFDTMSLKATHCP
jgi:hypothetical protein